MQTFTPFPTTPNVRECRLSVLVYGACSVQLCVLLTPVKISVVETSSGTDTEGEGGREIGQVSFGTSLLKRPIGLESHHASHLSYLALLGPPSQHPTCHQWH